MDYNYERFDEYVEAGHEVREFAAFTETLRAGGAAPGGSLTVLDGDRIALEDLWAKQGIVLEFGSFT